MIQSVIQGRRMDKRVEKIFKDRIMKKRSEKAKYLHTNNLYDTEYIEDIDKKFRFISTGKYVENTNSIKVLCERVSDGKLVYVYKYVDGELHKQGKRYSVYVPIELDEEVYNELVMGEDSKPNNSLSAILRGFAIFYYIMAGLITIIGYTTAAEDGGYAFFAVLIIAAYMVFNGLLIHTLSYLLTNVVSINRKIK